MTAVAGKLSDALKCVAVSKGFKRRLHRKMSYRHKIGKDPLLPLTLGNVLQRASEQYGDRDAVISVHQEEHITYKEALERSDKLAAALRDFGLQKGDRVGIWSTNMWEWYIAMFGCARAGVILVTINPAYQPPELEYCINKVGLKSIICQHKDKYKDYYDIVKELAPELSESEPGNLKSARVPSLESVIVIGNEELKGAHNFQEVLDKPDEKSIRRVKESQHLINPDEGFNIQFTSGTTGQPKAALVSHFTMVNNSYQIGFRGELFNKHHKMCVQTPFFHAMGTVVAIPACVHFGSTVVIPSPTYMPDKALEALAKERCTVVTGTPTMYVDLVNVQKKKKENIAPDLAITGGAPCSPRLFEQIKDILKVKRIQSVYGLTEMTAVAFQSLPGDDDEKVLNTVGHVGDHLEVKVVDEKGNIVPCGSPGELYIRGYSSMLGYWGDQEKTKETIGSDKWLKTGDRFILEESGHGRIVGRNKEMIIRGGENIYPKEIEDFLSTHPDILECHVIGIPHERLGEEIAACIRVKEGAKLTEEDIAKFCKGKLSHFKIPSKVKIVNTFPKTGSGKVQKFKLKEWFSQQS